MADTKVKSIFEAGAQAYHRKLGPDWRPIEDADHSMLVEIACTSGLVPHYDLYKFGHYGLGKACWYSLTKPGALSSEENLFWRPYTGEIADYVDPTNGMQNDSRYWLGAQAAKLGLPADYYAKNVKPNKGGLTGQPGQTVTISAVLHLGKGESDPIGDGIAMLNEAEARVVAHHRATLTSSIIVLGAIVLMTLGLVAFDIVRPAYGWLPIHAPLVIGFAVFAGILWRRRARLTT